MAGNGLKALRAQLGAPPPKGIAKLRSADLQDLADAVAGARRQQAAELAAAGEKSLGHIPKLLRGPVRKVLGS